MTTHYVYVDSRDAVHSNGNTDFLVQLNENLQLGPDTTYRIDSFRMVNSMPNITTQNQNMYVHINGSVHVVPLPPDNYSAQALTQVMSAQLGSYAGSGWNVSFDSGQNSFKIKNSTAFYLVTDAELAAGTYTPQGNAWPSGASKTKPLSFNSILGNYSGNPARSVTSFEYLNKFLDLQIYDYVQLRSQRLASHKVTSARSEHSILLKADVNVAFGEIIEAKTPNFDSIHLGRTPHKALDFQITDRVGAPIPFLYDPRISFILVLYG
jgi:hypothetical protein